MSVSIFERAKDIARLAQTSPSPGWCYSCEVAGLLRIGREEGHISHVCTKSFERGLSDGDGLRHIAQGEDQP